MSKEERLKLLQEILKTRKAIAQTNRVSAHLANDKTAIKALRKVLK